MQGDPLWIDVTELMQAGTPAWASSSRDSARQPALAPKLGDYVGG